MALGSGGTQLRKGPVYTERLLYAAVSAEGRVEVVNTLGLRGHGAELSPPQPGISSTCVYRALKPRIQG